MWRLWKEGDRKAALAAIPDHVVDELIVWGTPEQCREHVQRYVDNGVTTPALAVMPFGVDQRQAIRDLAPRCARDGVAESFRRNLRAHCKEHGATPPSPVTARQTGVTGDVSTAQR